MSQNQAVANKKRPATETPFGGSRPLPSSGQAPDQQLASPKHSSKRLKSVVAGNGVDNMDTNRQENRDNPPGPHHHGRDDYARARQPPPRGSNRRMPSQASLGGRLGEQVNRQLADLQGELAEADGYIRWLESEMRTRDATIHKMRLTGHRDELKQEREITIKDLRAEVSTKNAELSVRDNDLQEKQAKLDGKQKQLAVLMATKENEVDQKLKALAEVRNLTREVKKNATTVKLATGLVESNSRGEWKKGGALMEDLVAAVTEQEMLQPQAVGNAMNLTGEEERGPYRVSLESSITNRFRRGE